ncbi:histone deacetylase 11 [Camarhynchus parvulus]|uniref:histone deacetylase 11 n=1 Tax=Geospiza parvula TaxID=87175 RepID=UPI001237F46C|nr:histone deacetylase 11 [Camarhynchus parvulus]
MPHRTELYEDPPLGCWPIVYSPDYNITFMGLEKLHPFDAGKWGKIINFLKEEKLIADDLIVQAREATDEDLLVVHTRRYLNKLKWSFVVATITEIPPVAFLPNFIVQRKVLKPLRTQTGGTIMAGKLAMDRGWAINVGGGFHHCSSDKGGGFCAYADITLAIKFLFERVQGVSRATIIDLDAHQGNGHERDFMDDPRVYIMDAYNRYIYPGDGFAKRAIKRKVELEWGTEDTEYLQKVQTHVEGALNEFKPDIVVYNAGTDILDGDPLGGLAISPQVCEPAAAPSCQTHIHPPCPSPFFSFFPLLTLNIFVLLVPVPVPFIFSLKYTDCQHPNSLFNDHQIKTEKCLFDL